MALHRLLSPVQGAVIDSSVLLGLGRVAADEAGPIAAQFANGVVDVSVADEAQAVVAKQYLALMQAPQLPARAAAIPVENLRQAVPENRHGAACRAPVRYRRRAALL